VRVVFTALLVFCPPARAKPGAGTLDDPIVVDGFPYAARGDTTGGSHALDGYACGAQSEAGPERVYRFTLPAPARVTAWVESSVDVDVHLLGDATAASCVARGDIIAEAQLDAGEHFLVVDSYQSDANAGAYVLHLDAVGDAWIVRPLAEGVEWHARRFQSAAGGPQVANLLVVNSPDSVQIRALAGSGCQTVGAIGAAAGAIAGVNGGYFDAACAPVSLLKASGVLVGKNGSSSMRGAIGLAPSPSPSPLIALVGPGADWPAAFEAHGGGPILAHAAVPRVGSAAWSLEGFSDPLFLGPNPRTFAGFDAAGAILLGTVDGRRPTGSAAGMSMDSLSVFVTSADVGLADAVNLDGGGSSTMWIAGATPNGVVNYPSDGGNSEDATHPGARGVSGGWFVFAPPYDHPPRFTTVPPGAAAVGTPYVYDADAIDIDVDDMLAFRLDSPPAGVTVDAATGVVQFVPAADDPPRLGLTLIVSDGRGAEARQSWLIDIAGAMGAPDAGTGGSGSGAGCGCSLAAAPSSAWPIFVLLFLYYLRRKHA
jgi:Phosphodiester glycosidase